MHQSVVKALRETSPPPTASVVGGIYYPLFRGLKSVEWLIQVFCRFESYELESASAFFALEQYFLQAVFFDAGLEDCVRVLGHVVGRYAGATFGAFELAVSFCFAQVYRVRFAFIHRFDASHINKTL